MGRVNIIEENGQLGATLQTNDGIMGLVLTGISAGDITAGIPFTVTSLTDAKNQGLAEDTNPFAFKEVKEYYDAATAGSILYLMLVPDTMKIDVICDKDNEDGAAKLINYAQGRVKVLGAMTDDTQVYGIGDPVDTTNGINDDVFAAATKLKIMADHYASEMETPFRGILGGTSFGGVAGDLTDFSTGGTNNRAAILIGDTVSGAGAALGLCLGWMSTLPVQRKISRVRNGALPVTDIFFAAATIEDYASQGIISAGGYITFVTYPGKNGYFFDNDATLSTTTDDYHWLARGRVIDKAHALAYHTFLEEVDDEVPVDRTSGKMDAGYCKWLSTQMENAINNTMTAGKEISGVSCSIDPNQNVLSTGIVNVVLHITPVGYAGTINVSLGFDNPANN